MPFVFILYALFASVFVIEKTCLQYTQPLFLVGSRMLLSGLLLLAFQYFFTENIVLFQKKHLWKIIRLAIFNIYLTNTLEVWALGHMTAFKTCFIYSLSPFISALISYFIFSEVLSNNKWIGLSLGFAGAIPVLLKKFSLDENFGQIEFLSLPEISMFFAMITSVYGWILLKQLIKEDGYPFMLANGLSMLIGGSISLVHSLLIENWDPLPITNNYSFLQCFTFILIVSNLLCYNLYAFLLKKFSVTFMSFAGFSTPMFTAFFGWMLLGENVTWPFYLSSVIVFIGLFIFSKEELKTRLTPIQHS